MDTNKVLDILNEIGDIDRQIQKVSDLLARMRASKLELVEQYKKEAPYYKIEYISKDSEEYTYRSYKGYRHNFQWYYDQAKAVLSKDNTPIIKAYIWEGIPYEDTEKELIGLYEPKLILTL